MGKAGLLVAWLVASACGRIGFDSLGIGDANGDGTGNTVDASPTLSCAGLESTCGPAGNSPCCGSPIVPGGTFYRSYDVATDGMYTDMTNPATVSDFRLDAYLVTVGRFRQFVDAGMGTQANPPTTGAGARMLNGIANQGGWDPTFNTNLVADTAGLVAAVKCDATVQTWTDTAGGVNEALPMNCITWFEAFAFCAWDRGFMPTEAEWNYASTGGNEQRAYPWSSPPAFLGIDCSYADYDAGPACVNSPTGGVNRVGSESPKGDGKWGQSDLAGNLWEWTLDWYVSSYTKPCTDCANLTPATNRGLRGGYFGLDATSQRAALRNYDQPDSRDGSIGVRCARTP